MGPILIGSILLLSAACGGPMPSSSPLPSAAAEIAIPSCSPEAACPQGFFLNGRFYFFPCVNVRPDAVDDFPFAAGAGEFREVRRIPGLPPELFLAVTGDVACSPGGQWWLAQTEDAVAELDRPLRDRLRDVTRP